MDIGESAYAMVLADASRVLYALRACSGCADSVDTGESAYAMVLADDLDGDGRTDLLPQGVFYAVRACSGCADSVDIGESAYAMVLADDLDGDGRTDLLLATMNGNLYSFRTAARAHPLRAWPSEARKLQAPSEHHGTS